VDRRVRTDRGFTIVEVLIALVLISVMAAGVASLVVMSARSSRDARTRATATLMAAQKMEQLRGDADGLAWSPADAADRTAPGYVDYLDATGSFVGTGAHAPPAAAYVRRWSVRPAVVTWCDCVVFTVAVAAVVRPAPWRDARLVSLRARTPRVE